MQCSICKRPITPHEAAIRTSSGGQVHIACADRAAGAARRTRALRAAISGALLIGLVVVAALARAPLLLVALGCLLGLGAHVLDNRSWWRLAMQAARLKWRWLSARLRRWRR